MKTTFKISDYPHRYQSPEVGCIFTDPDGVLCTSLGGASVNDLTPETDQTTWGDLY